ncbi:hypothetical protein KKC1_26110 [Calderihabitans maritimus]|uniref:DUF1850 domain-containing protein n=1 Tax=Calderihabitans maritimus TaxID=1246530 RepID=A0A1Z5HVP3_9FIRM|nr:hypothetical protein KKC1_26110 [Calderihabitans maritimus]
MMSTLSGAHYLLIITFSIIFILTSVAVYGGTHYAVFQVKDFFSGEVVFEKLVRIGTNFTLAYIHSVTNQPVYEVFTVEDNHTLAMVEMRYDSFGANLPVGPEKLADETTRFIVEDGYYKILYENRRFEKVPLRVGQVVADHTLIFPDGTRLRFLDVVDGGAYVEFYVMPLLDRIRERGHRG